MRTLLNFLLKYDYWLLFILLEVVSFVLLFRFNNYQGSVLFTSANSVVGSLYATVSNVTSYFGLHDANRKLTYRNAELELQVEQLKKALYQSSWDSVSVAKILHMVDNYALINAQVVNSSIVHKDNYVTIDKGCSDGVYPEMGVINGISIIGIVYKTSSHFAIVLPILNSKSNISCKIQRTNYIGTLIWEGGASDKVWLKDIPRHSEFSLGDTIVTSGYSAVFPEGIPVGTINEIKDSHDGLSYRLQVKLFTDFARLDNVCVIDYQNRKEQTMLEDSIK